MKHFVGKTLLIAVCFIASYYIQRIIFKKLLFNAESFFRELIQLLVFLFLRSVILGIKEEKEHSDAEKLKKVEKEHYLLIEKIQKTPEYRTLVDKMQSLNK